jgi:eukaryotic-like serine/threonine-protein kinase
LKEARAASRLSHPCIVPIHEVFEDQGRPWFAMELIEGTTLRTLLAQRGALPPEDVARYGEMLADALHAAHSKHVLHRDVTPSNIFITADGRLLLADFGLARVPVAPDATTTGLSAEHMVGTLGYMSPEQMTGRDVGPQGDIFSAGVVLFQMATGVRPFEGRLLGEVLDATLNRPLPPLAARGDIPADLEHVIRKALARRLDERYASAEDMLIDLRALRRRLESGDRLPIPMPPRPRWRRTAIAALGGFVAIAAVAGWAWRNLRETPLPQAVPHQITAGAGWEAEAKISPDGSDVAYSAEDASGNVDIWLVDARGGTPIRLTDDPALDRSPSWYPDGSAIAFVSERNGSPCVWKVPRLGGQTPTPVVAAADAPAVSPDGSQIAFTRPDAGGHSRIVVAPLADTSIPSVLTTDRDGLWDHESPAWSPDGRTICYAGHTDLWTVPAEGGRASRLTVEGEADFEPAWSPDGRWVYFSSMRGGTTAIWRVPAGGGTPGRVTMGSGPERQPSLSKDGSRLTYSTFSLNSNLVVRVEKTGKEYEFGGERRELSPAFAPDGSAVAYVSDQLKSPPDLWIQPLSPDGSAAGAARRLTDQPGSSTHPSYSPDGRWIAYYRVVNEQRDIWIVPADGGTPLRFTDDPAMDVHPAWSPDGRQIAFVSERGGGSHVWLAAVANGKAAGPARQLTTGPLTHFDPSWSPDSSAIAFVATDAAGSGDVWVVGAQTPGDARRVTRGAGAVTAVWSPVPGHLLVSGTWGTSSLQLMFVSATSGRAVPAGPPHLFGARSDSAEFTISPDGRFLAFVRQVARGDIWVMQVTRGRY